MISPTWLGIGNVDTEIDRQLLASIEHSLVRQMARDSSNSYQPPPPSKTPLHADPKQ